MIMNKKNLVVIAWLAVSTMMSAQSVYPGQHQGKMKKETVAPIRVQSFDLKDVRLLASQVFVIICCGFGMVNFLLM